MSLSDVAIRKAKPGAKPYKLSDERNLFVLVQPSGAKLWRFRYWIDQKEVKLSLGQYPDVSLSEARQARDRLKSELAAGRDPRGERKRAKANRQAEMANTFDTVAAEFILKRTRDGDGGWAPRTIDKNEWIRSLLKPALGNMPVADITPADMLAAVRKIEAKGNLETARRALQFASGVFRYAVATARLTSDPTRDLKGALTAPKVRHRAAILDAAELGELLRAIDVYTGNYSTRLALRLAPHVFVRPGELRQARWNQFDLDEGVWTIPAAVTKMRKEHVVPLSTQAIAILNEAAQFRSREDSYVFPSVRSSSRPISENTLNAALRRLGFTKDEMTTHGFRATASTLLNEARDPRTKKALWSADAIERALAHDDSNKVRAAYHRGDHWDERVEMAQWWSDHLDMLRKGADIVPIRKKARA